MGKLLSVNERSNAQTPTAWTRLSEQERSTYAARIRGARADAGMTQQELAAAAGISRGTVANMESGRMVPQADHLRRAMLALGLKLDGSGEWSESVNEWVGVLAPLIERIPKERRGELLGRVVVLLGESMADPASR